MYIIYGIHNTYTLQSNTDKLRDVQKSYIDKAWKFMSEQCKQCGKLIAPFPFVTYRQREMYHSAYLECSLLYQFNKYDALLNSMQHSMPALLQHTSNGMILNSIHKAHCKYASMFFLFSLLEQWILTQNLWNICKVSFHIIFPWQHFNCNLYISSLTFKSQNMFKKFKLPRLQKSS